MPVDPLLQGLVAGVAVEAQEVVHKGTKDHQELERDRLVEALRLAGPLGFADMAARYRAQRPSVVRLHPWMRDIVPPTLRLARAQRDATEAPD